MEEKPSTGGIRTTRSRVVCAAHGVERGDWLGSVPELSLSDLLGERDDVTPGRGGAFAEAAAVCLDEQGHELGVHMQVGGSFDELFAVSWPTVTEQMRRQWNDPEEATENGAYGVAILLTQRLTGLSALKRSRKGPGFDYWVGKPDSLLFQDAAGLEVSGIRQGDSKAVAARVRQKLRQVRRSDGTLPAYVVVVEFSAPRSQVVMK